MHTTDMIIPFWSPAEIDASLRETIAHLASGGVLAYPTETVYGFGTAVDHDSVESLVRMKGRPPGKPFLLLIGDPAQIARLDLHLPAYAAQLAARFWPGPLTLVLRGGDHRVPPRLRGRKAVLPFGGRHIPDSNDSSVHTASRLPARAQTGPVCHPR